jgi:hypothetical protein
MYVKNVKTNLAKNYFFRTEDNVHAGKLQEMNENFFCILKVTEEGVGCELDPYLLVRGTDPLVRVTTDLRIWIRTEMSRNPPTAFQYR